MKTYFAKIYESNGDYIDTLKGFNFSGFRKQINGGLGELVLSIPKKFDDFEENYIVKLNNKIEVWCADSDTGTDGLKIYSGFISRYEPYIDGEKEGLAIRCLGFVSKLATSILKNGTQIELKTNTANGLTTGDTASACEIKNVIAAILDRFQAEATNPLINYSSDSMETCGNTYSYTFNAKYYSEAIEKCRGAAPEDWWWYVGADNILKFRPKPPQATHTFMFGKHFKSIKVSKNMENVVNRVLFSSGDNSDRQICKLYSDAESEGNFDDRWAIVTDNRVSIADTADNIGESFLAEKKDAEVKTVIEILDNNGNLDGYDIESINPGDTCKFVGFNDITSLTFTNNMKILGVEYTPDSVILEIENLNPSIARENQDNKKKIAEQEASGRAVGYDTDQSQSGAGLIPVGSIAMFGGASAPNGWLLCQGQSVLRADYPRLFAILGTTFGSADGTHFTLPDLQDKFPMGKSGTKALGSTGGAATQDLSHVHSGPSHSHTADDHHHHFSAAWAVIGMGSAFNTIGMNTYSNPSSSRQYSTGLTSGGTASDSWRNASLGGQTDGISGAGATGDAGTGDTGSAGSSSQSVLNPYQAVNYIIKI